MATEKEQMSEDEAPITIRVMAYRNSIVQFRLKKNTPLRKMMNAFCDRAGLDVATVRFRFDGEPINENDTVLSKGLKEGDTIEAYQAQTGGWF